MALKSSQDIMSYFKFTTCKRFYNKYQETHLQLVVERKNNNNKKGKSAKELTRMKRMIDKSRCRTYIVSCTRLQNNNFKDGYQPDSAENNFCRLIIPLITTCWNLVVVRSNSSTNLDLSKCSTCLIEEDKVHFVFTFFFLLFHFDESSTL